MIVAASHGALLVLISRHILGRFPGLTVSTFVLLSESLGFKLVPVSVDIL
jgi:hypothetical protein